MGSKIHLECMLLRDSVAVAAESVANYLLVKIIPAGSSGQAAVEAMPLNVALVLDVSGSMYGEHRLEYVQAAVTQSLNMLKPHDIVSVVAFGRDAKTVLEAAPAKNTNKIKQCVEDISNSGVNAGGTSMHLGIQEGVKQIRANLSPNRFNRVVVLTDGQTSGEDVCRQTVKTESGSGISFSAMGVGTDWNEDLLKDLSDDGQGNWHYIDSSSKAKEVFQTEFKEIASTAFSDARLIFRGRKGIEVRKARQVVPECMDLALIAEDERQWAVDIGSLQNNSQRAIVLDMLLPQRPDGQYEIGSVECTYDVPADKSKGESTGAFDINITYTSDASQSYINGQVAKYIDELQTFAVAEKIQTALAQGDRKRATMLANNLLSTATKLGSAGAKKTQLASRVMEELEQSGTLSRETQLALKDGARKTQLAE